MSESDKAFGFIRGGLILPLLLGFGLFGYLVVWMLVLGDTLVNDELVNIEYVYRVFHGHGFYATPFKLYKPLSLLMALPAAIFGNPHIYQLLVFMLASLLVIFIYLSVERVFDRRTAILSAALVGLHFNTIHFSLLSNTMITSSGLAMMGTYAAIRLSESRRWLALYAVSFFLSGLSRPEAWMFAGPVILYALLDRKRLGLVRPLMAAGLILLAPVIWFGKDYFINDDLLHSVHVALRDKEIGTGAPYGLYLSIQFYFIRILNKVSWPAAILAVAGLVRFIRSEGWRGLIHPLVLFPAMLSAYVLMLVYKDVYPMYRFYYFPAMFYIVFAAHGLFSLYDLVRSRSSVWKPSLAVSLPLAGGLVALALTLSLPAQGPNHILLGIGCVVLAILSALVFRDKFREARFYTFLSVLLVLASFAYGLLQWTKFQAAIEDLKLEARKQAEMFEVAEFLSQPLLDDPDLRILMPSRRNEQLNWIYRDRPIPDTISQRESFYLNEFKQIGFLDLHPEYIVYLYEDYQFWGPRKYFEWLSYQDHTRLYDVEIDLVYSTNLFRVFEVNYPAGWPEKMPLPSIP